VQDLTRRRASRSVENLARFAGAAACEFRRYMHEKGALGVVQTGGGFDEQLILRWLVVGGAAPGFLSFRLQDQIRAAWAVVEQRPYQAKPKAHANATLRTGTAGSQDESPCRAIQRCKRAGGRCVFRCHPD
jgi:hypothetical protein